MYFKDHSELIIDTRHRQITYLATDGKVERLTVREANNSKDEELKKRFDYIKGVLKGEEKPSKSRSPERQDTAPKEKAPQKKDSQGQGS